MKTVMDRMVEYQAAGKSWNSAVAIIREEQSKLHPELFYLDPHPRKKKKVK